MIAGHISLEDTQIHFRDIRHPEDGDTNDLNKSVELTISDNHTGMERTVRVTYEQLGALCGLSICGTNEKVMEASYPIAEAALPSDWPKELRPMP